MPDSDFPASSASLSSAAPSARWLRADIASLAMLAVLLLGWALRLHRLAGPSLWLDEMGQASFASGQLADAIDGARIHHGAAPLDYLLTWLAVRVAMQDLAVRLTAVLAGTVTLALVYKLGRELFGSAAGLVAALLLALSPFHLLYSREARFYALFTALAVASTLALVQAIRRDDGRGWVIYGLLSAISLYAHYYTVVLLLGHGLAVLAVSPGDSRRRALVGFSLSVMAALVAFLPWVFYAVLAETGTPRAVLPELSASLLRQIHAAFVVGPDYPPPAPSPAGMLQALFLCLAGAGAILGLSRRRTRWATLVVVLPLLFGPPLIVLGLRLFGYFFAVRQVLYLLPFYLLLVALGAVFLVQFLLRPRGESKQRAWAMGLATVGLVLLLAWLQTPARLDVYAREQQDWRGALAFVGANAAPNDVIVTPGIPSDYFRYYAPGWYDRIRQELPANGSQTSMQEVPAMWVVVTPENRSFSAPAMTWLEEAGAMKVDFGRRLQVFYWAAGQDADSLVMSTLTWTPPRNEEALRSLLQAYAQLEGPKAVEVRGHLEGLLGGLP